MLDVTKDQPTVTSVHKDANQSQWESSSSREEGCFCLSRQRDEVGADDSNVSDMHLY